MNSKDLTREQLETLAEKTRQMRSYLHTLTQRMERRGFPVDDPLFVQAQAAFDKVQHLWITLHYLECDAGKRG